MWDLRGLERVGAVAHKEVSANWPCGVMDPRICASPARRPITTLFGDAQSYTLRWERIRSSSVETGHEQARLRHRALPRGALSDPECSTEGANRLCIDAEGYEFLSWRPVSLEH